MNASRPLATVLYTSSKVIFCAASIQERLLFEKYFLDPDLCGFYSRAASNRERLLMARVRYPQLLVNNIFRLFLAYADAIFLMILTLSVGAKELSLFSYKFVG